MHETDSWALSHLMREAIRNVLNIHARLFPVFLAAILLGAGHVALAAYQGRALDNDLSALSAQGRGVVELSVVPPVSSLEDENLIPPGIDRSTCEALGSVAGVQRAGLLGDDEEMVSLPQVGSRIPMRTASATLIPALLNHDLVVGSALAETAGRSTALTTLTTTDGQALSAIVDTNLGPEVASTLAVFRTLDPAVQSAERCMVVLDPRAVAAEVAPVLASSINATGAPVRANVVLTETTSITDIYLHRVERFLPLLLGILGGLVVTVLIRVRSSELATYRLAGSSPRSMAVLLGLEATLLAGAFLAASSLAILVLTEPLTSPAATMLWSWSGAGVWLLVALAGAAPMLRRTPSDMAKDR